MNNLELYLNFNPAEVVSAESIESLSPLQVCYYTKHKDRFLVSTSVISIIRHLKSFELNKDFNPDYSHRQYYDKWDTIDKRINRLETFKRVSKDKVIDTFNPLRVSIGKAEYLRLSMRYMREWLNILERSFPNKQFVVFTGGKDSRMIHCIEKLNPKNWHVFSSEPNGSLVKEWLEVNNIKYGEFFTHSGLNDENEYDFARKVMASDYMCRPSDIRWSRKAFEIANHFKGECVFLLGNAGDTLYANRDNPMQVNSYENFFKLQRIMTPGIQGTYHQTISNITGCPVISIYAYDKLWYEVYQLFNPAEFKGQDLRRELGNLLIGRELKWFGDDPLLRPDEWKHNYNPLEIYKNEIAKVL